MHAKRKGLILAHECFWVYDVFSTWEAWFGFVF